MLYKDSSLKGMSYAEWKKRKQEQEKQRTHNAEKVKDVALYDALYAVSSVCFDSAFNSMPLYFIPKDLKKADVTAMYGYECIMIDKAYYMAHGIDTDMINTLFHELAHAYCDRKQIKDTDHEQHLQSFADVCNAHGAECMYDMQYGYSIVKVLPDNLRKIRGQIDAIKNTL